MSFTTDWLVPLIGGPIGAGAYGMVVAPIRGLRPQVIAMLAQAGRS